MIKDDILDYVRRYGSGVSLAELSGLPGFAGDQAWGSAERNIWFWFSCSAEAADALQALLTKKLIELAPAAMLVYLIDGLVRQAPRAKRLGHVYKTPHWLPVTLQVPRRQPARRSGRGTTAPGGQEARTTEHA